MILKGIVFVMAALTVAFGVIGVAQYQSKSRSPKLTTDDVGVNRTAPAASTSDYAGGSIVWHRNMSSALSKASSSGGVVIVDVYTDWCGWCKRMDKDIYEAPSVVALSGKNAFLKFNAEDGGEGEAFSKKMNVRGFPTTIILDSKGEVLQTARGYLQTPERFINLVEHSRSQ